MGCYFHTREPINHRKCLMTLPVHPTLIELHIQHTTATCPRSVLPSVTLSQSPLSKMSSESSFETASKTWGRKSRKAHRSIDVKFLRSTRRISPSVTRQSFPTPSGSLNDEFLDQTTLYKSTAEFQYIAITNQSACRPDICYLLKRHCEQQQRIRMLMRRFHLPQNIW